MPEIWARAEVLPFSWRDYRDNSLPHSFLPSLCSTNKRLSICDLVCSHNASRVICSLHTLRRRCTVPEKRASRKKERKKVERKEEKKELWLPGTIINNRSSSSKDTFAFYYFTCTRRFSLGSNRTWWIPRSTGKVDKSCAENTCTRAHSCASWITRNDLNEIRSSTFQFCPTWRSLFTDSTR